jgi:hypothetical protein
MLNGLMHGPWLGIFVMTAMIVGLVWWIWWAMKADKDDTVDKKE